MFNKYVFMFVRNVCIGGVFGNVVSIFCIWIKKLVVLVLLVFNMEIFINFFNFIYWRKFDYKSWLV